MDAPAPRRAASGWPLALLALALLASTALLAVWSYRREQDLRRMPQNELDASFALRVVSSIQDTYYFEDPDGDNVQQYWTGSLADIAAVLTPDKLAEFPVQHMQFASVQQILQEVAAADPSRPGARPCRGYWFVPIPADGSGKLYRSPDPEGRRLDFGYCAYPARYGVTGRVTFIIDRHRAVAGRDLRGAPAQAWPAPAEFKQAWTWYSLDHP